MLRDRAWMLRLRLMAAPRSKPICVCASVLASHCAEMRGVKPKSQSHGGR